MPVAALYDIHGNLPALEAVLDDVLRAPVDEVVVGGDVFPGPLCDAALDRLLALDVPVHFIQGNGDRAVLALATGREPDALPQQVRTALSWNAQQLEPVHRRMIADWPATLRLEVDGLNAVLFCHATPRSDTEVFTRLTPESCLRPIFECAGARLVVCGHTHMQFDRMIAGVRVVNAGSVGMPYGGTDACWLLLGPDVQLRRTRYDLAAAAERIRATDYPDAEQFAGHSILRPLSEQQALDLMTPAELK